ncbi:MAG: flagellar assembly protein FliH [Campylobacterota bacterium]|nr:flagellar assembly protein FliH [Campylobacterota bacterium]
MAVVISKNSTDEHNVNKYKFKVLSFTGHEDECESSSLIDEAEVEQNSSVQETIENHEISSSSKDELVESLLKKTDEMSSNFIKLQMRLEEKENEFKTTLEIAKKESYEQGLSDAKEQLKNENEKKQVSSVEQFSKSVLALEKSALEFETALGDVENELINAAVDIAKEVILVELDEHSSDIAAKLSHELIQDLQKSAKVTLKVNPNDHGKVSQQVGKLERVEIISDSAISPGGVVALSESGNIDSEIMKRYERVKKAALGG